MLVIGCLPSNFSFTKSGKIKSCTFRFVSRTRLRSADDRRSRRGRCGSFLTTRGYARRVGVASLTPPTVPCRRLLIDDPPSFETKVRLFADRYQQFIYENCIRHHDANLTAGTDSDHGPNESKTRDAPARKEGSSNRRLFRCPGEKCRNQEGCGSDKSFMASTAT